MEHFTDVDAYLAASTQWPAEIIALRAHLLAGGLDEQIKWGKPCYSHHGANVVIIQEMRDFLALMFFKGALLADPDDVLHEQGPNSRSARRMQFADVDDIEQQAPSIAAYLAEAIAVEDSGAEIAPPPEPELVPELQERLDADAGLRTAFETLTPGRRREYHLHISAAKRSTTRISRIDACIPKILAGKGLRDR